jgi:4-amino-4-deoxy-L-arabinose transferase-like glycosyltransferase
MAWRFRRYVGRIGALVTGVLVTISPSLLFHSRYIRDDIYIAFFLMVWIYGLFRYMDTRERKWLAWIMVGMSLGILAMEAHFISGAILGAFFVGLALWQVVGHRLWLAVAPVFAAGGFWYVLHVEARELSQQAATATEGAAELLSRSNRLEFTGLGAIAIAVIIGAILIYMVMNREKWQQLRRSIHLDLAVFMLTLVMPFTGAFFLPLLGWSLKKVLLFTRSRRLSVGGGATVEPPLACSGSEPPAPTETVMARGASDRRNHSRIPSTFSTCSLGFAEEGRF